MALQNQRHLLNYCRRDSYFLMTLFVRNVKFILVKNVLCDTQNLGKSVKTFALKYNLQTFMVSSWRAGAFHESPHPALAAHWILGWCYCGVMSFLSWNTSAHEADPGCCVGLVMFPLGQGILKVIVPFFTPTRSYITDSQKFSGLSTREDFGFGGSSLPIRKDID